MLLYIDSENLKQKVVNGLIRKKRRYILLMMLMSLVLLLSACGKLTIKLKADGSGQSIIEFDNSGFLPPVDELKRELEMNVADEEGIKNVKVQEKRDKVIASVDFENITALDSSAYEIPVADLVILEDDILDDLTLLQGVKEFTEKSSAIFVRLPGDVSDFGSTEVIVPGKIVAHSEGASVEKKDTISFDDSTYHYVVYEPSSGIGSTIGIIVVVVIIAAGGLMFFRKRQAKPESPNPTQTAQTATKGE